MVTAVVPNAEELIAARQASGMDRYDEVIKGVYFMVPPSSSGHGQRQLRIGARLLEHGLIVATEAGVGFPDDYLVPDIVVYRNPTADDIVYADPATVRFVVEITSEANTGPHWEAKLARLADWELPVVIFDGDDIANRGDLDPETLSLF